MAKPLVQVIWNDAWGKTEECVTDDTVDQLHKPLVIKTLGYLLKTDDVGISLANEFYADEQTYRGYTFIPRAMIKDVIPYKLTRPRKPRSQGLETPLET